MHDPPPADHLGLVGTQVRTVWEVRDVVHRSDRSVVYRAVHGADGRTAALKAYVAAAALHAGGHAEFRRTFVRVGRTVRNLARRQPAIVRPLGGGWVPDADGMEIPCMLLEWLPGSTLQAVLDQERERPNVTRTSGEVLELLGGPLSALAAAHQQGLCHRELKPSNMIVCGSSLAVGTPLKLLDLSVAKPMDRALEHAAPLLDSTSPTHAAPEQFRDIAADVGPWTDVFALALIMVELMRGGRPALGGRDYAALRRASEDPARRPTPASFGLAIDADVEAVFARALEVDPDARYRSAGEFVSALRCAVQHERRFTSSTLFRVSGEFQTGEPAAPEVLPTEVASGGTVVAQAPVAAITSDRTGDTVRAPFPVTPD